MSELYSELEIIDAIAEENTCCLVQFLTVPRKTKESVQLHNTTVCSDEATFGLYGIMNSHSYVYWSLGKANIHVDKEVNLLKADSVMWTLGVLWRGSYLCFHYTVLTGTTNFGSHTTKSTIIFCN